ncbi:hypothetical protein ACE01N_16735 [Saccharicrinis sp. FJH2]|uniref:hypothetical protein n=1 Tax=Saccharicrinis sp. FJH65 TaxID=3344659 RepID=UPI0035F4D5AB
MNDKHFKKSILLYLFKNITGNEEKTLNKKGKYNVVSTSYEIPGYITLFYGIKIYLNSSP